MKIVTKTLLGAAFLTAGAMLFSCQTMPLIPNDMSAQELIQNGQSAFESGNYKASLHYFNAVVERYPEDPAVYIEAKYEIGHLYMKKKQYKAAVPILEEIRDIYPLVPPGTIPAAYEKLATLELAKLSDEQLAKIHMELEKSTTAREKAAKGNRATTAVQTAAPAATAATAANSEQTASAEPAAAATEEAPTAAVTQEAASEQLTPSAAAETESAPAAE